MSIFKSTLKPFVAAQLKAREKVISSINRDSNFLKYTSGKNGWVRMMSMVDYTSQIWDAAQQKWVLDGRYEGNQLSKKYILEGGTLFNRGDKFVLRRGVNSQSGIYGSNIDKINSSNDNSIDRTYGIRPMPGISSISVINRSAYGSLREATIQFYAWDKHQLEELEILFMRPGYTVFLEWGWSQYLHHGVAKNGINSFPDDIGMRDINVSLPTQFFKDNILQSKIYEVIDANIEKNKGNYDAMIGYVKNFSWQLMSNGGFQCTTTLISRGEVLEGIKASSNPQIMLGSFKINPNPEETPEEDEPIFSFFEQMFLSIKAHINKSEFSSLGAPPPPPPPSEDEEGNPPETPPEPPANPPPTGEFYSSEGGAATDEQIQEIDNRYKSAIAGLREETSRYAFYFSGPYTLDGVDKYSDGQIGFKTGKFLYPEIPSHMPGVLPTKGTTDGSGIEYISFDLLIAILQRYFIPVNKETREPLLYLVIPEGTPCLASEDSVSIDPTVCLISNSYAKFITDSPDGFQPTLYSNLQYDDSKKAYVYGEQNRLDPFIDISKVISNLQSSIKDPSDPSKTIEISYDKVSVGRMGSIYLSIGAIIETYRSLSSEDGVNVIDFLKALLEKISFSLGGINDFQLFTDKNYVQIIDAKYFEPKNSKFKLDPIGLKSICRDVKMNSRIYPEQASMIAIAAASGDNNNLGDIYTSTQATFNKGLKDRIFRELYYAPASTEGNSPLLSGVDLYYLNIYNNIKQLTKYLKRKVLVDTTQNQPSIQAPTTEEIQNAGSLLKTLHYQLNGKDVDFKALIPFELEITLDGISGFVVGQIFKIDTTILPKDYYNKNLGFVITGVNHTLQNNDWTTDIKTQICLLDNEEYGVNLSKLSLKQAIENVEKSIKKSAYLGLALVDYTVYLTKKILAANPDDVVPLQGPGSLEKKLILSFGILDRSNDPGNQAYTGYKYVAPKIQKELDDIRGWTLDYLKKWHTQAKQYGLDSFPETLDDFYSITTPSGNKIAAQTIKDLLFNKTDVIPGTIKDVNGNDVEINQRSTSFIKFLTLDIAEGLFLYKAFGDTPSQFIQAIGGEKDKFNFETIYTRIFGSVQNFFGDNPVLGQSIIPNGVDEIISLEYVIGDDAKNTIALK
jgi:hypothetical protein